MFALLCESVADSLTWKNNPGFRTQPLTEIFHVKFEILTEIHDAQTIAAHRAVRDRRRLNRIYGHGHWQKMKGTAVVRLSDGTICDAELHWYEAHGIGRKEIKFKKPLDIRGLPSQR